MAPCPLNNKVIVIGKQKESSVNCCWLELLLGRCRVLPPVLTCGGCSTERQGTTTYPIHLLCSKNQTPRAHREGERQGCPFLSAPLVSAPVRRVLTGSKNNEARLFLVLPLMLGGFVCFFLFNFLVLQLLTKFPKVCGWLRRERVTE